MPHVLNAGDAWLTHDKRGGQDVKHPPWPGIFKQQGGVSIRARRGREVITRARTSLGQPISRRCVGRRPLGWVDRERPSSTSL